MAVKFSDDIQVKLRQVFERIPGIVADGIKSLPFEFGAYVSANFGSENRNPVYPHSNTSLYDVSGKLLRAVSVPNSPGYATKVKIDKRAGQFQLIAGVDEDVIPYAMIHEYGGDIPITAKMRRYFWFRFMKDGGDMWRGLALTKKTEITITARPYMEPALEEFNNDGAGMQGIVEAITAELNRIF